MHGLFDDITSVCNGIMKIAWTMVFKPQRTQYKKPLYKGQDFLPQIVLSMQFKPLKKENLSIKDN